MSHAYAYLFFFLVLAMTSMLSAISSVSTANMRKVSPSGTRCTVSAQRFRRKSVAVSPGSSVSEMFAFQSLLKHTLLLGHHHCEYLQIGAKTSTHEDAVVSVGTHRRPQLNFDVLEHLVVPINLFVDI